MYPSISALVAIVVVVLVCWVGYYFSIYTGLCSKWLVTGLLDYENCEVDCELLYTTLITAPSRQEAMWIYTCRVRAENFTVRKFIRIEKQTSDC